jgi:DNA-binding SARP family transcriptional activator
MEILVLGPLELRDGDSRVVVSAAKQQVLLALLLVQANQFVQPDELAEALWPEGVRPAKTTLHSLVYRVRRMLGAGGGPDAATLSHDSHGYMLRVAPEAVDLYRFERLVAEGRRLLDQGNHASAADHLRAGLALWRGEAFAGVEADSIRARATSAHELRLDALEWRLTASLRLGEHRQNLDELKGLVAEHPYREGFWELLMAALYQSGQQAAALEAYQRLYQILDHDLGIQPGPNVQELQRQILSGASKLGGALQPTARPRLPVPRLLPTSVGTFVGREEELKALDALLPGLPGLEGPRAASTVICLITGTGGIGKTALALRWAHHAVDSFPDGQLHVNLRGFDPSGQPVRPTEAIRHFLLAFGLTAEQIPVELEARAALFRSLLAGKRVLVLLDNAADEQQVRPLLPASPGCLVLVTSRRRLRGLVAAEAACPIVLDPLGDDDARELLLRRLGKSRVATQTRAIRELIDGCGGLPLALTVVAAQAATRPELRLGSFAARIRTSRTSLDPFSGSDVATDLRAVFSWSYTALGPHSARLFRLLGLHPGPDVTVPAAASLVGVPAARSLTMLDELAEAQLLTEHQPGRYLSHDLLRAYAAELAGHDDETERRLATRRLVEHYVHTAHAAARTLHPQRAAVTLAAAQPGVLPEPIADGEHAFRWLDAERPVLSSITVTAFADGLDAEVCQLAWALADYYERRGLLQDRAATGQLALKAAQRLGEEGVQAREHRGLGKVYGKLSRYTEAETHLEQAFQIAAGMGDFAGQGGALQNLAGVLSRQGRDSDALDLERRAVDLFRAGGRTDAEASALNAIGWRLARLGAPQSGLTYCQQALALQTEIGDRFTEPETWDSIGFIQHVLGDYSKAVDSYQKALDLFEQLGRRYWQADTLTHLGDTLTSAGDTDGGRRYWQEALAIFHELGHPDADKVRAKLIVAARSA